MKDKKIKYWANILKRHYQLNLKLDLTDKNCKELYDILMVNEKKAKYSKKYYNENKDKIKKSVKKYCENNKEKIKERNKKYYENNKEKIREKALKYYQKNKEKIINNKRYKKCFVCKKPCMGYKCRECLARKGTIKKKNRKEYFKKYYQKNKEKINNNRRYKKCFVCKKPCMGYKCMECIAGKG